MNGDPTIMAKLYNAALAVLAAFRRLADAATLAIEIRKGYLMASHLPLALAMASASGQFCRARNRGTSRCRL